MIASLWQLAGCLLLMRCVRPLPGCSELGGVYESCNLFLGLGRPELKSQVGLSQHSS